MFDEEYMLLSGCIECNEQIKIGEKKVLIYKNAVGECWVHAGECWEKYKKLLTEPDAIKRGCIIGICDYCAKPVRTEDDYIVGRIERAGAWVPGTAKEENPFYTAFPLERELCFAHKQCDDQAN